MTTTHEKHHDELAQEAGEAAYNDLLERGEEGDCGCETCVVREILTAAYEHLVALAFEEARRPPVPREPTVWVRCAHPGGCVTDVMVDPDRSGPPTCGRHR
jgi:hypothetical protein